MAAVLRAARYDRLVIAAGPRSGKTWLAEQLQSDGVPLHGSDELIDLGWSEASQKASEWFDADGPWIAEGVALPRALRKWLARGTRGKPADCIVWLGSPVVEQSPGQLAMARGCLTVWSEIRPHLDSRGVTLLELP